MHEQAVQPTTTNDTPAIFEQKVEQFAGQVIADMAAGMSGVMVQVDNVRFEVATAETFTGDNYDLICYMDSFHDMGNPLGAVAYARRRLSRNGSIMLVEPVASDRPEENFHALGRLFYAASTAFCVPNSHSQPGGYTLGAQAGPAQTERIINTAGYSMFRIARQTPINLIYEAKA